MGKWTLFLKSSDTSNNLKAPNDKFQVSIWNDLIFRFVFLTPEANCQQCLDVSN